MTNLYLIDTDVLVDFLRGVPQAVKFLQKAIVNSSCAISTITIAELYVGVREGQERTTLDEFIAEFQIIAVTNQAAKQGGLFRRDFGKSHGVGLADAILAATAVELGATLVTLNKKHYPMLKELFVPYKK